MDKDAILTRLHSLTGSLKPAPGSRADELPLLQRSLLEQLAINPDLAVSGNRTSQEFAHPAAPAEPSSDFNRLLDHLTALQASSGRDLRNSSSFDGDIERLPLEPELLAEERIRAAQDSHR